MTDGTEVKPIHIKAKYVNTDVALLVKHYVADESPAIVGYEHETGAPLFTATVCLPDPPAEGCVWLKGWSENEGIPEALVEAGVVRLTGRKCYTGYCEAIEARLLI